jgi:hypothetical protein
MSIETILPDIGTGQSCLKRDQYGDIRANWLGESMVRQQDATHDEVRFPTENSRNYRAAAGTPRLWLRQESVEGVFNA